MNSALHSVLYNVRYNVNISDCRKTNVQGLDNEQCTVQCTVERKHIGL